MSSPEMIYLAPACHNGTPDGRTWCEDDVWTGQCDDCGSASTGYVRADLHDALVQRCRELEADVATLGDGLRQAALMGAEAEKERDTLRAEVERLRTALAMHDRIECDTHAEVERIRSMTAMTMGIGDGGGNLFIHGDYESIKRAQAMVIEAEKLRDLLRECAEYLNHNDLTSIGHGSILHRKMMEASK